MFSTPNRKIRIYTDQENKITSVQKSASKGIGARCRTPLADLNGARPLSRQRLKDSTIKEERLDTPKRSSLPRLKHASVPVKQTPSGVGVPAKEPIDRPTRSLTETETNKLPSANPVRSTLSVPSPLSSSQIAALMSPSIQPLTEESSSVIPLTSFDPRAKSSDDEEADISLLAGEIVGEAIKNAEQAISTSVRGGGTHSSYGVEAADCFEVTSSESWNSLSPSNGIANISIGDISPVHRMEEPHSSAMSGDFLDCSSPFTASDKEVTKASTDSGLSIDDVSVDFETSTEEISLDSFLSFGDDSCMVEKSENLFLSLTPSKILKNAPKIVIPFPKDRMLSKSEYDIVQSVDNLWTAETSTIGASAAGTSEVSTFMTPCKSQECSTSPIGTLDQVTSPLLISVNNAGTAMTPVHLVTQEMVTDQQSLQDTGVGDSLATMLDMSTHMTPCKSKETGTSPVATSDQVTSPMPMSSVSSGTAMTPVTVSSKETGTDRQSVKDAAVGDGIATTLDTSTHITPCKSQECGTSPTTTTNQLTSPIAILCTHSGTAMSPIGLLSKETETDRHSLRDVGVGDSSAAVLEISTEMTPRKSKECGTSPITTSNQLTSPIPLPVADAETATSPVHCVSRETGMSPSVSSSVDAETSTTPIMVSPVRLSSFSRTSENSVALMEQMKSSHISNKLLRREVSSLKQTRTKWEEHLRQEQLEMKQKMYAVTREKSALQDSKVTAKAAAQTEIDNLLAQVGQQLGQIADLESKLKKKDEDVADLEQQNAERKTKYCNEIKELQEDLCMAYKQHEAEILRLKDESENQSSYERLYHDAIRRNHAMEEEMAAYDGLGDIVERTAKLQERMPLLQNTVTAIRNLYQQTIKEREELAQQQNNLTAREESMTREDQMRSEEHSRLVAETAELREAADGERKKTLFAETEAERLQEELLAEQQERKNSEQSLQIAVADVTELTVERDQLLKNIEKLTETEQDQRNTWEGESGRLVAEIKEMKEENVKLNQETNRLLNAMNTLKEELATAIKERSEVEEKLQQIQESKEFVDQERESLEEYCKEMEGRVAALQQTISSYQSGLQDATRNIQQYELTVQQIKERLIESQSELEHTRERAHHIIMQQGAQISSASTALAELIGRVGEFSLEVTTGQTKSQQSLLTAEEAFLSQNQSSLVFSILNSPLAAEGDGEDTSSGPPSLGKTPVSTSGTSAFSRFTPARKAPPPVLVAPPPPPETERSIAELVQASNDAFNQLFERVIEKIQNREQKVQELLAKSKDLEMDFLKAKRHHGSQLEHVQQELTASDQHVRQLKQELRLALNRMYNQQDRTDAQATQLNIREVERLKEELHQANQELGANQEHIATLSALLGAKPDPGQKMALLTQLSADNAQLKRKLRNFEGN